MKSKSVNVIYVHASKSSYYILSESDIMVYRGLGHRHEILAIKISKDAGSAEIEQNSSTSNSNISETVSYSVINIAVL